MTRLVIHPEDIKAFRLPPQKVKGKDPRGKGFKRKFGNEAATVELDALPVEELRRHVSKGIEGPIDFESPNGCAGSRTEVHRRLRRPREEPAAGDARLAFGQVGAA